MSPLCLMDEESWRCEGGVCNESADTMPSGTRITEKPRLPRPLADPELEAVLGGVRVGCQGSVQGSVLIA
jgi:hypothetical protein